jgi:hypothetical protein
MSLRFATPQAHGHLILIEERTDFLKEISDLVALNRFAEAIDGIRAVIAIKQDADLLELLGRVYFLQYSHEAHISGAAEGQLATLDAGSQEIDGSEGDFDLFVWQESPVLQKTTHHNECIEAAVEIQTLISSSTPVEPKAINWCIDVDDGPPPPFSFSSSVAETTAVEKLALDDNSAGDVGSKNNLQLNEEQPSLECIAEEASRNYFDFQLVKLQPEDKELLGIIRANPKIGVDELARAVKVRPPLLNHTLGIRLRYWIERDRLGGFSIKRGLLNLLSPSVFETHNSAVQKKSMGLMPKMLSSRSGGEILTPLSDMHALSDQAKQVLRYFIENPGQKTYKGASALEVNHMALLSLLDGCLEEYLERDSVFSVRPRPQACLEETDVALSKPILQFRDADARQILSESAMIRNRTDLTNKANLIDSLEEPPVHVPVDAEITVADLAKAAAISRLPLLGKQILAQLASAGKGYSRDLARKLEHDVDEVNKMLLHTLNEHVSVVHSVWRLNSGVIDALKLAAII